ncbi:hypothetical protein Strop_1508 [Salinispora tropica CNB-440]|uniref:Transposase IS4-like domain-containing protein n=2 Tax=Salinispora tropica TaxID=168695 RepID=A4X524_SALTO|nr:hypothetical protein Strop_1508 [Salinispora tropica CNB-440]
MLTDPAQRPGRVRHRGDDAAPGAGTGRSGSGARQRAGGCRGPRRTGPRRVRRCPRSPDRQYRSRAASTWADTANRALAQLMRVAGIRWSIEASFQTAKSQVGLDQHQVRRWDSWHRFTTVTLAALAVLTICAADAADQDHTVTGLITLTVNEIRRLTSACIIRPINDLTHRLHWSGWRRRHQARA